MSMRSPLMEEAAEETPAPVTPATGASDTSSFYYGWIMLPLTMAALIASSPGQTFGVSIFNEPMRLSLGLSHGSLAAAYMLGTLFGALPISFIGRQMDRHGPRRTLLAVVTCFSLVCVLTSLVQGWLALVVAFCFLRMLGPGALSLLSGSTLAFWFERRLGMVEGVRQLGMAIAMMSIPLLNLWLVSNWGWRGAYGILGVGTWLVLFPLIAWLFRDSPADVGQKIDGVSNADSTLRSSHTDRTAYWGLTLGETLTTAAFWIVACGTSVFGLIHTAVFFCIVPIFQERGLSASHAAAMLTVFAGCLAIMQLCGGMLADRLRASYLLAIGMAGLGVAILLLLMTHSPMMAYAAGGLFGASQGLFFGATQPLWARYFGRRHLGSIRGLLMTLNVAFSSLGPLMAGLIRDWQGDFTLALITFAVVPWPIAVVSLWVAPPVRSDAAEESLPALAEPVLEPSGAA